MVKNPPKKPDIPADIHQSEPDSTPNQTVSHTPPTEQQKVRDYWPQYKKQALLIVILVQVAITVASALILIASGLHPASISFIVSVLCIAVLTTVLNYTLVNILLAPLRDLSATLTHVSGEPNDVTLPSPNTQHLQRDGFKPLIDLIYKLASADASIAGVDSNKVTDSSPEQSLSAAFHRTKAGVVAMTGDGKITYASPAAPVIEDSDGNKVLELIFDVDKSIDEWRKSSVDHLVRAEHTWRRIANRLADDPKRRFFDISASYEQGSPTEIIVLFIDRTEIYMPEEDQLDFISFAAHELRGPVTVIRGYLDVLSHEIGHKISPSHHALIDRLSVSASRLSTYINNILNASRYDRRHLRVHLIERHLRDVYKAIDDDMSLRASTQNRLLSVSIPDNLPTVAADPSSLAEVFANLIDNALKYSHEGGTVKVVATANDTHVNVQVTDYGIGMPSNVMANLFHKFYRSHRSRESIAGTGIGLFISRAIIESHGGMIEAKSEVGKGSTFTFSLPIYSTVADKLAKSDNSNETIIRSSSGGWIKNHAKIRG